MFHDKRMFKIKKGDLGSPFSSQIVTDIKAKFANQEGNLRGGISRIYLSFSNIWEPCHEAINIRHVTSERHWKGTFNFTEIISNFGLKQRTEC